MRKLMSVVALSLVGFCASASDYDKLLDKVSQAWPGKSRAAVFCAMGANQMTLMDLTDAAKERGISIVIVDLNKERDVVASLPKLRSSKIDFVVMMEDDPIVGLKSSTARTLAGRSNSMNVPSVSISPLAVDAGVVLVVESSGKTTWNAKIAASLGVSNDVIIAEVGNAPVAPACSTALVPVSGSGSIALGGTN